MVQGLQNCDAFVIGKTNQCALRFIWCTYATNVSRAVVQPESVEPTAVAGGQRWLGPSGYRWACSTRCLASFADVPFESPPRSWLSEKPAGGDGQRVRCSMEGEGSTYYYFAEVIEARNRQGFGCDPDGMLRGVHVISLSLRLSAEEDVLTGHMDVLRCKKRVTGGRPRSPSLCFHISRAGYWRAESRHDDGCLG